MLRPDPFRSEVSFTGDSWRIALFGELDLATTPEAERAAQIVRAAAGTVTLDLRGLQFMDAAGLHLIMRLNATARRDGFSLYVVSAAGLVRSLLGITGIDSFVDVVDAPPIDGGPRLEHAVIATDIGGLVTVWNTHAERLYGWSALEVLGRSIMEVTVGPEDRQLAEEIMREVQRAGHWEGEFEVRNKTGSRFSAHVRNALVTEEDGSFIGFVGLSVESSQLALT